MVWWKKIIFSLRPDYHFWVVQITLFGASMISWEFHQRKMTMTYPHRLLVLIKYILAGDLEFLCRLYWISMLNANGPYIEGLGMRPRIPGFAQMAITSWHNDFLKFWNFHTYYVVWAIMFHWALFDETKMWLRNSISKIGGVKGMGHHCKGANRVTEAFHREKLLTEMATLSKMSCLIIDLRSRVRP